MPRRIRSSAWAKAFERSFLAIARNTLRANARAARLSLKTQAKGMKTQAMGLKTQAQRRRPPPGEGDWIAGLALGAMLLFVYQKGSSIFPLKPAAPPEPMNTQQVGMVLFQSYLLPFEIASLLLLVAIVGAVVMAKKRV